MQSCKAHELSCLVCCLAARLLKAGLGLSNPKVRSAYYGTQVLSVLSLGLGVGVAYFARRRWFILTCPWVMTGPM